MSINILQCNVLDAKVDAIILSVDGAAKGMEGNISRQFALRWPVVWQEIQDEISQQIPLGNVIEFEPVNDYSFRLILMASTLHHREVLSGAAKQGIIRDATEKSLKLAARYSINTVAAPLMVGGWRLKLQSAFLSMVDGYESARRNNINTNLDIHILQPGDHEIIRSLAGNIGWRGI
jgi:O-acetyl-ADP-ribose deacetylase (regulator of RNase III)